MGETVGDGLGLRVGDGLGLDVVDGLGLMMAGVSEGAVLGEESEAKREQQVGQ